MTPESIFNFIQNPLNILCDLILKQNLLYESTVSPDMCGHKLQHYQQDNAAVKQKNAMTPIVQLSVQNGSTSP